MATGRFEFAARIADRGNIRPKAAITFELCPVARRALTWPQDSLGDIDAVGRSCWCQDEVVREERRFTTDDLRARKQEIGVDVALEIYSNFGWTEPLAERLQREQGNRFGSNQVARRTNNFKVRRTKSPRPDWHKR